MSIDLIYARQDQSLVEWEAELGRALSLGLDHLSLYQLTIEADTRFGELHARGALRGLPRPALAGEMYEATQRICGVAGLPAYEISNHARPGCESRHNLVYWRYGDYAGIGPGAHGRLSLAGIRVATETLGRPEEWLAAAEAGCAESGRTALDGNDQAVEMLMMGLRLAEGVPVGRFAELAERPLPIDAITELRALGLVALTGGRLRATEQGRVVLEAVLRRLLA